MGFEEFIKFDIVFFTALLLFILLVTIFIKKDVVSFSSKMFRLIIIANLSLLVLEILSWIFDGVDTQLAWYLNYLFNFILILFTPLIGCIWASYIDHKMFNSIERVKKRLYYMYPFIIGLVMSIINLFYPILFKVSADNVYSREPLIWVNVATLNILLFYMIVIAYKNRKAIDQNVLLGVVLFLLLPSLGGVLQMIYLGVLLIWPMFALGVVVAYIFLETVGSSKDYLTNLYTRVKSDEYIKDLISRHLEFSVIMIDLEKFKELNDNFGHAEGDNVLRNFGIILMNVFTKNSLVSRFGGDEFLIITQSVSDDELLRFKKAIAVELKKPTYLNKHLKSLGFSFGYSFHEKDDNRTIDQIIVEADNRMYEDKAINKNYKRRKSDR